MKGFAVAILAVFIAAVSAGSSEEEIPDIFYCESGEVNFRCDEELKPIITMEMKPCVEKSKLTWDAALKFVVCNRYDNDHVTEELYEFVTCYTEQKGFMKDGVYNEKNIQERYSITSKRLTECAELTNINEVQKEMDTIVEKFRCVNEEPNKLLSENSI